MGFYFQGHTSSLPPNPSQTVPPTGDQAVKYESMGVGGIFIQTSTTGLKGKQVSQRKAGRATAIQIGLDTQMVLEVQNQTHRSGSWTEAGRGNLRAMLKDSELVPQDTGCHGVFSGKHWEQTEEGWVEWE